MIKALVSEAVSTSLSTFNGDLPTSVSTTYDYIQKLGANRACGPEGLHAKLLKAGGLPLAVAVNRVERRSIAEERVLVRWKGGRLVDSYKKNVILRYALILVDCWCPIIFPNSILTARPPLPA